MARPIPVDNLHPEIQEERHQAKLANEARIRADKRFMIARAVGGAESLDIAAIFVHFTRESLHQFLEHFGRFFLFPIAGTLAVVQTCFAWYAAYKTRQKRHIVSAAVDTGVTLVIVSAIAGGLFSAAFAPFSPYLFAFAIGFKTLFTGVSALYNLGQYFRAKAREKTLRLEVIDAEFEEMGKERDREESNKKSLEMFSEQRTLGHDVAMPFLERKPTQESASQKRLKVLTKNLIAVTQEKELRATLARDQLIGFTLGVLSVVAIVGVMIFGGTIVGLAHTVLVGIGIAAALAGAALALINIGVGLYNRKHAPVSKGYEALPAVLGVSPDHEFEPSARSRPIERKKKTTVVDAFKEHALGIKGASRLRSMYDDGSTDDSDSDLERAESGAALATGRAPRLRSGSTGADDEYMKDAAFNNAAISASHSGRTSAAESDLDHLLEEEDDDVTLTRGDDTASLPARGRKGSTGTVFSAFPEPTWFGHSRSDRLAMIEESKAAAATAAETRAAIANSARRSAATTAVETTMATTMTATTSTDAARALTDATVSTGGMFAGSARAAAETRAMESDNSLGPIDKPAAPSLLSPSPYSASDE